MKIFFPSLCRLVVPSLSLQPLIYPMNPSMMQPPPHNGMMNMQQPGPYINQQVKRIIMLY